MQPTLPFDGSDQHNARDAATPPAGTTDHRGQARSQGRGSEPGGSQSEPRHRWWKPATRQERANEPRSAWRRIQSPSLFAKPRAATPPRIATDTNDAEPPLAPDLLACDTLARFARSARVYTRANVIDAIQSLNPSVGAGFLDTFDDVTLVAYLDRLMRTEEPRGSDSTWTRPAGTPAITCNEAN